MRWKSFVNYTVASVLILVIFNGCSIKKLALNQVANALTGEGSSTVFTGDDDPELIGDALPFTIKMYESLLAGNPKHKGLQLMTGSLYIMYANAFLHTPAMMMTDERLDQKEFFMKRAKKLYIRGRDIILDSIEKRHPGFLRKIDDRKFKEAAAMVPKEEIDFLYWGGAGWMGAFAIDPLDAQLGISLPGAEAMLDRILELDEHYSGGDLHNIYILYYGSLPDYMGGSFKKAREHFQLAMKATDGRATSPYVSLATTVSIQDQNVKEFKKLMNKVLQCDLDADPENRLVNVLNMRQARWFLDHIDDFFLPQEPEEGMAEEDNPNPQSSEENE